MKKIFPFLIMLLLFTACHDKQAELEESSEYTELANYNGGVVTSKMWAVIDGKKDYMFNVRMPDKTVPERVHTSKELFSMFDIDDTIRIGDFEVEEVLEAQNVKNENFDNAREEILSLQKERTQIINTNTGYDIKTDGLSYSAVILIDNKPYMITMKEIKQ